MVQVSETLQVSEQANAAPAASATSLDEVFVELEQRRRATLKNYWLAAVKCLLWLPLVFLPLACCIALTVEKPLFPSLEAQRLALQPQLMPHMGIAVMVSVVCILGGLAMLGWYFNRNAVQPKWRYVGEYKNLLYSRLCELHFSGLAYQPDKGFPWKAFDATGLFRYKVDWYQSEDYFEGRIGSTDVFFCEAHAKRERKNWGSDTQKNYLDTFFQGLVFVADFHKHFHSTTRLIPVGEQGQAGPGKHKLSLRTRNSMNCSTPPVPTRRTYATS